MTKRRIIVGLTGPMASGKGVTADYLKKEKNFKYISLSDMVREEVKKRGLELTRENMQNTGNDLRKSGGAGILGKLVREKIESLEENYVVDGIRNPSEVNELKKLHGFFLVALLSPIEQLVERIFKRKRDSDPLDKNEILKKMEREWGIGEPPEGQQVGLCVRLADFYIANERSLNYLYGEIERVLSEIERKI